MTSDRTGRSRSRNSSFRIILISAVALLGVAAARHRGDDPPSAWTRTEEEAPRPVDLDDPIGGATGWDEPGDLRAPQGVFSDFLLTHTDAQVTVTGPVAHTVVTQTWENPNRDPVDGLYIFPLPENAAVTDLTLRVGARRIEGVMRRREEARDLYERARAEGRVTALLDQERPNVFAQQVANIMPGMRIEVTIELDQEVRCDDGDCAYVLPTVVGPRFIPARQADPGRIAPPVAPPGTATGQGLSFRIEVDAGMPVRDLRSVNHPMRFSAERDERMIGAFSGRGSERLDRDVEVRWRLGGRDPEFGVLAWRDTGESREPGVFTLYVAPPIGDDEAIAAPRELVFVLDCSGSMSGEPIEAAKNVVRQSLGAGRPGDTLQILRFSDRASGLWPAPVAATPANVRRALEYLDTLHGEGGTEMLSGIRAALDPPADPERLRLVAFLTDGYIGNEAEILGEVRRRLADARIFAFGIGSSVNRYLLENLAQEGRGAAAFLGPRETPDAMVRRFVERIETPVFTDLRLSWEGLEIDDQEPAAIPDLFAGQPLVVHGHYDRPGSGAIVLEGTLRGRRVTLRRAVTLPASADHEALARLWARARIDRLTRESYGSLHPDAVQKVTDLGLRFHLMTPYTSLVAVDRVVSNRGGGSTQVDVPVELPSGVSYEGIFGDAENKTLAQAGNFGAPTRMRVATAPPPLPILGRNHQDILTLAPGVAGDARVEESAALPTDKAAAKKEADNLSRDRASATPAQDLAFLQLVLVEEDGTRRIVESDGEAWIEGRGRRSLVRTLTADQLAAIAAALDAASTEKWEAGDATWARGRARIVLVTPGGMTRSRAPALLDARPGALLALLRAATS